MTLNQTIHMKVQTDVMPFKFDLLGVFEQHFQILLIICKADTWRWIGTPVDFPVPKLLSVRIFKFSVPRQVLFHLLKLTSWSFLGKSHPRLFVRCCIETSTLPALHYFQFTLTTLLNSQQKNPPQCNENKGQPRLKIKLLMSFLKSYLFLRRIIEALAKNNEVKSQGMWHRREI